MRAANKPKQHKRRGIRKQANPLKGVKGLGMDAPTQCCIEEETAVNQVEESGLVEVEWWGPEREELSLWEQLLLPTN